MREVLPMLGVDSGDHRVELDKGNPVIIREMQASSRKEMDDEEEIRKDKAPHAFVGRDNEEGEEREDKCGMKESFQASFNKAQIQQRENRILVNLGAFNAVERIL